MFFNFNFTDPESRYINFERKYLIIIKYFVEIKWLIIKN